MNRSLADVGIGRCITNNEEYFLSSDLVDSCPIVNKLAAAIAERQATYFYTHTCNQKDHFGV
jgi:hypothetical protein